MLRFEDYPNRFQAAEIEAYIRKGVPAGDFLEAVLCNDMREACARADTTNQELLFAIVEWLHNETPAWPVRCWGSPDSYREWLELGGLDGYQLKCVEEVPLCINSS